MVSDSGQSWPLYGEVVPDNDFGRIKKRKGGCLLFSLSLEQAVWNISRDGLVSRKRHHVDRIPKKFELLLFHSKEDSMEDCFDGGFILELIFSSFFEFLFFRVWQE
ncbi:hypothetical protein NPIL_540881 [Nephila pilipes]|uniref:Uncharacterized protein n=1 Tax=Nephila pilipes TaxID=299642 RepID=A0A8X6PLD4_NEPPI|nr:hypothetical protein NPIL_540881 [Nephila pilipes]